MRTVERRIQTIAAGKRDNYKKWETEWAAIEEQLGGFPAKRRYQVLSGHELGTAVWEREWESMAVMEDAYTRLSADPRAQELGQGGYGAESIILRETIEFYFPDSF
jgi:hypothetical protein